METAMRPDPRTVLAVHARNMAVAASWREQLLDLIDAVQRREAQGGDDGR
jgi:hypothetical protein